MTGHKPGIGLSNQPVLLLQIWDELLDQGLSPWTVVDRIGEFVMPGRAVPVKEYVDHFLLLAFLHRLDQLRPLTPCRFMIAAKSVHFVNSGIGLSRIFGKAWRQDYAGLHHDGPPPEL